MLRKREALSRFEFCPADAAVLRSTQVLNFRHDSRLWALDAWLLVEVSHSHLPFADAYLAQLLGHLLEYSKRIGSEINIGGKASTAGLQGSKLKDVKIRLGRLASRSERLRYLCGTALAKSDIEGLA